MRPTRAARWRAWAELDAAIYALHPSLSWNPEQWHSPRTSSIEGYSRVLIESYLITSCSKRLLDVMLGQRGCFLRYDRREGSDLCECLLSRCVAVMGQDKSSKYAWLRMFGKIVRQARRQTMLPALRNTPMFTQQHTAYETKEFKPGLRSCPSTPRCIIGGEVDPDCVCSKGNRHSKSDSRLLQR